MVYRIVLASVFFIFGTQSIQAQQQAPSNPAIFGFWQFATENGMMGNLSLVDGSCRFTVTSSFASQSSFCRAIWDTNRGHLQIIGLQETKSNIVPEYLPLYGKQTYPNQGIQYSPYTFHLKKVSRNSMSGHLLGAGNHVTVRFKRH